MRPDLTLASPVQAWSPVTECPSDAECCCGKPPPLAGGVSTVLPRQISKPVLGPWYAWPSERAGHQADAVILRIANIPERTG